MNITGTHFNYYQVCKRKLWLFANAINFEQTSDLVYDGKLVHEKSYPQRAAKYEEVEMYGIKVDFYDAKNKVIHEIKRSNKVENAHIWQVKYYIFIFEQHDINGVSGILEYPTLRKTEKVELVEEDREKLIEMLKNIEKIISSDECPDRVKKGICKSCSYFDFCFAEECD